MFKRLFMTVLLIMLTCQIGLASEFILVVNKANPDSQVSVDGAKKIFLGKTSSWSDSTRIKLVVQKNPELHEFFVKQVVRKSGQQFLTYWKKALFTGVGTPPPILENDTAVKNYVAANRGAVGYISADSLDDQVKLLEIK